MILGYRLEACVDDGGQADVWRATHEGLARTIAIKALKAAYRSNAQAILRLKQEARLLSRLKHQNILSAENFIEEPPAILMEYMAGGSLRDKLPSGGFSKEIAWAIFSALLDGVQAI
ncbi:protein kinase, partial [Myxococcota bacterium]|nr:protein kinase [Myxococcota bacterium]